VDVVQGGVHGSRRASATSMTVPRVGLVGPISPAADGTPARPARQAAWQSRHHRWVVVPDDRHDDAYAEQPQGRPRNPTSLAATGAVSTASMGRSGAIRPGWGSAGGVRPRSRDETACDRGCVGGGDAPRVRAKSRSRLIEPLHRTKSPNPPSPGWRLNAVVVRRFAALCRCDDAGRDCAVRESNPRRCPRADREPLSRRATSGQLPPWRSPPPLRLPTRATRDSRPDPPSSSRLGPRRPARAARARASRRACGPR